MISAVDAHVHLWTDDLKRYPRLPGERDYAPARFTPEDLFVHTRPAGVARVVLIQMSFYRMTTPTCSIASGNGLKFSLVWECG